MTKDQNPEQMPQEIFAWTSISSNFNSWSEIRTCSEDTSYTRTSTVNQLRSERDGAVRDLRVAVSTVNSLMAERDALKEKVEELENKLSQIYAEERYNS
jgi:uncharacterized coiled-coil DUF342 family protein